MALRCALALSTLLAGFACLAQATTNETGTTQGQTPGTYPSQGSYPSTGPYQMRSGDAGDGPANANTRRLERSGALTTPGAARGETRPGDPGLLPMAPMAKRMYRPSEFERYVQRLANDASLRRMGAELLDRIDDPFDRGAHSPLVPPDYLIQPGDEVVVTIWGSVDADLRLVVDRSGRIAIPRAGAIMVAGTRYAELPGLISSRVATVFKNFQLSVSLGQLRGIRVFVTGFVNKPGVLTVSALTTLSQALIQAEGPAAAGSFRHVELRRGRDLVASFDLYKLLLQGDRSEDRLLQPDDVIHVGPIGKQVAVIGSVNRPAIFELKGEESLDDALRMAGGFAAVADPSRLSIERLDERSTVRVQQIELAGAGRVTLNSGDVLRAFNSVNLASPVQRQNKRVRVEGEVLRPGEYVMPANSTITDALQRAGGLTSGAFVFGTEFSRESVREVQQQNYERALRDLETSMARAATSGRVSNAEEAASQSARMQASSRLIERLRSLQPSGRVVLQISPSGGSLPDLALEDGDRVYVPARPSAVGVFGSVFNAGNYLFDTGRKVEDYLRLAGGPTRGADAGSAYVVRANGSVISGLQGSGWFGTRNELNSLGAEPGDTIFVPEELEKTTFIQNAKDWTQILYQFGIGIAGIKGALN